MIKPVLERGSVPKSPLPSEDTGSALMSVNSELTAIPAPKPSGALLQVLQANADMWHERVHTH